MKSRSFSYGTMACLRVLALCFLTVFAGTNTSGQGAKPEPPAPIPLDDRITSGSKLSSALKECGAPYDEMTPAQRSKVVASFKFIRLTIGFYLEDDENECNAMLAAALKNFCDHKKKKVNIVIDFGQKEPIKVTPDGSTKGTPKDTVSISGRVFKKLPGVADGANFNGPDRALPIPRSSHPSVRHFITILMAEALRIKHETKLAGVADPSALVFKNDLEVKRRKLDIEKDLKTHLQELLEDPFSFLNEPKYRINRQFIDRLLDEDDEAARTAKINRMLKYLCNKRIPRLEKQLKADWEAFKRKFGLTGDLGIDKIDEELGKIMENNSQPINFELWTGPSKKIAYFVVPDAGIDIDAENSYLGGGGVYDLGGPLPLTLGDTQIAQVPADTFDATFLDVTGVDHVYHAMLIDDGLTLLVSAGQDDTGDGLIIAYSDTDGDGVFEPGTRTEIIENFDIYGGTYFLTDPSSGSPMIFSRSAQALYQLGYSGGSSHSFPDTLTFRGSLGFQRFDLEFAAISDDGLTATATGRGRDLPFASDTLVPYSVASTVGGEFIPVSGDDYHPFTDNEREPIATRRPVEGDLTCKASGQPGNTLQAYEVSDTPILLGSAVVDSDASAEITLSRALTPTDIIRFEDSATAATSPDHPVIPLAAPPAVTSTRLLPHGRLLINYEGVPGHDVSLRSSNNLTEPFSQITLLPLDDIGTAYYEVDITGTSGFFRFFTTPPGS